MKTSTNTVRAQNSPSIAQPSACFTLSSCLSYYLFNANMGSVHESTFPLTPRIQKWIAATLGESRSGRASGTKLKNIREGEPHPCISKNCFIRRLLIFLEFGVANIYTKDDSMENPGDFFAETMLSGAAPVCS